MTDDLIKRLRGEGHLWRSDRTEAADALEAQASEIEALRNENAKLWGWLDTASQKGVATHGYMKGQR